MTTNILKHSVKRCGGTIVMDISNRFEFSTPSISTTPNGVTFGVMEIRENPRRGKSELKCSKCGEVIDLEQEKVVSAVCTICHKQKPAEMIFVSYHFGCTCQDCVQILQGEKETDSVDLKEIISYYLIPKGAIRFVPILDILSKQF